MKTNGIQWTNHIRWSTDTAVVLTGKQAGFVQSIKALAPHAISKNAFYTDTVAQLMAPCLHDVLDNTVKVLNFVKTRA